MEGPAFRGRRRSPVDLQATDADLTGAHGGDGYGCPGGADAAAAAGGARGAARAQHASGRGGAAALRAGGPGRGPHTFSLAVPFPSPAEADIARGSLAPDAEPRGAAVRKELAVRGRVLAVRWRAEDARRLRASVTGFLGQLALVLRTLRRFGPPLPR